MLSLRSVSFLARRAHRPVGVISSRSFAVVQVKTNEELLKHVETNKGKLVVIDWTASWCGPCKTIAPVYSQLSDEHKDVVFLKADVDELPDAAAQYGVQSMPTFHFVKKGELVDSFSGADANLLKSSITKNKK